MHSTHFVGSLAAFVCLLLVACGPGDYDGPLERQGSFFDDADDDGDPGDPNLPAGPDTRPCCVWIDLDGTLNTFGAWGYPFNPVPAGELCRMLSSYGPSVAATPLTARSGCLPASQPGEKDCRFLGKTVSVTCSSGIEAANAKRAHMRANDSRCSLHLLLDDNKAASQIAGGSPPIIPIRPRAFGWSRTRQEIRDALEGCGGP